MAHPYRRKLWVALAALLCATAFDPRPQMLVKGFDPQDGLEIIPLATCKERIDGYIAAQGFTHRRVFHPAEEKMRGDYAVQVKEGTCDITFMCDWVGYPCEDVVGAEFLCDSNKMQLVVSYEDTPDCMKATKIQNLEPHAKARK